MTADELLDRMSADIRTSYLAHVTEATMVICTQPYNAETEQLVEDHLLHARRLINLVRELSGGTLTPEWEEYFGPVSGDTCRQLIDAVEDAFSETTGSTSWPTPE